MNKLHKLSFILAIFILAGSFHSAETTDSLSGGCPVSNFYQAMEPENGVKVLTMKGNLEEADLILFPTQINVGSYEVSLSRVGLDLYKLNGEELYIETRTCTEFSVVEGVLKVDSKNGLTKGTLHFK